jgi:WhiB family redox-sensing transcriptional regulator
VTSWAAPTFTDPVPSSRPPVCRRTGCTAPATDDTVGLCERHGAVLPALRSKATRRADRELTAPCSAPSGDAWRSLAACRGWPVDWWYPPVSRGSFRPSPYDRARQVCASCPVVEPCALAGAHEAHGMWGGLTPAERRRQRRRPAA